ncbi:DUF3021 family protein [Niallia oryzisoli]|uniref:DUF3021 family protein n=1 Tax=Niallia oryzisoli TaxID=1737571 RepID=UPI003735D013
MTTTQFTQKMIKDFLIIFASIIIMITILRQMYYPQMAFDLRSIYIIMAFSLLSTLMGFILYTPNDISEKNMRIRIVIHFFTLEFLLIALGSVFEIVTTVLDGIILAVQIAVIYVLIRLLSWRNDKKEAQKINEKLNALKNNQ